MRMAGLVVWQAHQAAARILTPGITTAELNQAIRDTFVAYGAEPLFLNYGAIAGERPPFPAETCISINEEVVHGIPGSRKIIDGDIVSLDTGCRLHGWCGDAAITHGVGNVSSANRRLLKITNGVLNLAIELMGQRTRWSQICGEMERYVLNAGFSVVDEMVGHGIGKNLHEPPQVPNYLPPDWTENDDFDLRPGVVLAVEPMVNTGVAELDELDDRWTMVTLDRKPSAHFEHTVAITDVGPVRLTGPPSDKELQAMPDWLQDRSAWVIW